MGFEPTASHIKHPMLRTTEPPYITIPNSMGFEPTGLSYKASNAQNHSTNLHHNPKLYGVWTHSLLSISIQCSEPLYHPISQSQTLWGLNPLPLINMHLKLRTTVPPYIIIPNSMGFEPTASHKYASNAQNHCTTLYHNPKLNGVWTHYLSQTCIQCSDPLYHLIS